MISFDRKVAYALMICCLVNGFGIAVNNSIEDVMPKGVAYMPPQPYTNSTKEVARAAFIDKESEHEKILEEADKVIADVEELLDQYDNMHTQSSEKISNKAPVENNTLASRGKNIEYKQYTKVRYNLTDEEFKLMSQVVEVEAGGEPYLGQVAVANVILNRVKAGWAGTVTEVINQPGQFTRARKEPSDSTKKAVTDAVLGLNTVPEGTLFFQNLETSTDFTIPHTKQYVTKIGLHSFYR